MVMSACAAMSVANVYYAQPLLDTIRADLGISVAGAGGIVTATQLGCALVLCLVVPLGDLWNRVRLLLVQLALLLLTLLFIVWVASPTLLLLGMAAAGLFGTAMTQGLIAYSATLAAPERRGRVVGTVQGGVVVGLLLARVLAGCISDLAGWRAVYLASAGATLTMLLLLARLLPPRPARRMELSYPMLLHSMWLLLRRERGLQIRGMLALLMFAILGIFWSAMALPLSAEPFGYSHTAIGAFGLVGLVGALAAAKAGRWTDLGLGQRTSAAALLCMLFAWPLLAWMEHGLWALIVGIILLDMGGQAIHVVNQGMIFREATTAHSRLVACYMLFYSLGSGLGAIAATSVYACLGWQGVCGLGFGVSMLAVLFWWATLERMPETAAAQLAG
ncbi:hypothetical protein BI347_11615 [Chromobacterium sphagni]|uniref:Major facilitator superfamily (MFS) profile domain-containing protein n=2 Tax=Chromobacterium sphagni TaxID=1903179 RepID=A0A1S1X697_9NEIS|nr:hypothetical protein BI347_11615 [Chromobacterium sphagni]